MPIDGTSNLAHLLPPYARARVLVRKSPKFARFRADENHATVSDTPRELLKNGSGTEPRHAPASLR